MIYCRFLLLHVPKREELVKILSGLLKVGGYLVCEEPFNRDAEFSYPEDLAFKGWKKAANEQLRIYSKADFTIGKRLAHLFRENGLEDIKVKSVQPILQDERLKSQLWLHIEEISDILVKANFASPLELKKLVEDIKTITYKKNTIVGLFQYMQVSGKKIGKHKEK